MNHRFWRRYSPALRMRNIRTLILLCLIAIPLLSIASRLAEASNRNRAFLGLTRLPAQPQLTTSADQVEPMVDSFQGTGMKQSYGEGILAMLSGNCSLAISNFQAYLRLRPADEITQYWIGDCYARDGDWESAIHSWQTAGLARPLAERGDQLANQQRWQLARDAYRGFLTLTPNDCVYQARATFAAWWAERDSVTATAQLERVVTSCPDTLEAYVVLGRILIETGQFSRAEIWLTKAQRLSPNSDRPLTTLALAYLRQKQAYKALDLLQKADGLTPNRPSTLVLLGSAYADLGQGVLAVEAYENAIRLGAKEAWVYESLGLMYEKLNKSDEARTAYQLALKLDPNRETARSRLAKLEYH